VDGMLDVYLMGIGCWIADGLTCLVARGGFFGPSIVPCEAADFMRRTGGVQDLKLFRESAVFQKKKKTEEVCKLVSASLWTEDVDGLDFRLWPPFAQFSCALALKVFTVKWGFIVTDGS